MVDLDDVLIKTNKDKDFAYTRDATLQDLVDILNREGFVVYDRLGSRKHDGDYGRAATRTPLGVEDVANEDMS